MQNLNTYDVGAHYTKILQNNAAKIKKRTYDSKHSEEVETGKSKPRVFNDQKSEEVVCLFFYFLLLYV